MAKKATKKKTTKKAPVKKEPIPIETMVKSTCPKCGSTEREGYHTYKEIRLNPNRKVCWRRTACRKCGQKRVDRCEET